jgi:hypothetical protein
MVPLCRVTGGWVFDFVGTDATNVDLADYY